MYSAKTERCPTSKDQRSSRVSHPQNGTLNLETPVQRLSTSRLISCHKATFLNHNHNIN